MKKKYKKCSAKTKIQKERRIGMMKNTKRYNACGSSDYDNNLINTSRNKYTSFN